MVPKKISQENQAKQVKVPFYFHFQNKHKNISALFQANLKRTRFGINLHFDGLLKVSKGGFLGLATFKKLV
jgi:hypothetical protein